MRLFLLVYLLFLMDYFFELFFLLASVFLASESGFPKLLSKVASEKSIQTLSVDFFAFFKQLLQQKVTETPSTATTLSALFFRAVKGHEP